MGFRSWVWAFFFSFLLPVALAHADPPDSLDLRYKIDADFRNYLQGIASATCEVSVTNRGKEPLHELLFLLYPNRFRKPLPNLNDVNLRRIYVDGFDPGEIQITEGALEIVAEPTLPEGTLARLPLETPLAPGEQRFFRFAYRLKIPKKFGTYGLARDILTLSGGWYPYVASFRSGQFQIHDLPPRADWDVTLNTNTGAVISGNLLSASKQPLRFGAQGARAVSLLLSRHLQSRIIAGRQIKVQMIASEKNPNEVLHALQELAVRWLEFTEKHAQIFRGTETVTLAEAPLREALVEEGEGMAYVSDRAFKVIPTLRQYHSTPVVRGLFYQALYSQISRRENSKNYDWVTEAAVWPWTVKFMQDNLYHHLDARTLGPIRALSFLPSIDQVIYTPQFAFFDVFYDYIYPYDPVRDHFLRFNHARTHGRTVYAHLEDEVGRTLAAKIVDEYLSSCGETPLAECASSIVGKPMQARFDQWTAPRPAVNYVLSKHEEKKTDTFYQQSVEVLREADKPLVEPVELGVITRADEKMAFVWNDGEKKHDFNFKTAAKVKVLEVDPRRRLWETRLSDNRKPPHYKLVVTDLLFDYDFNANQPLFYLASQFRRSYGGSNRYTFNASYGRDTYGVGVGYTRLFGRLVDRLRLSHGFGAGFNFDHLSDNSSIAESLGVPSVLVRGVGPSGNVTALGIGYSFGNLYSFTNPLEGGGAGISATWGTKFLGGDFNYYRASIGGNWIAQLTPSHLLAFRGLMGISGPEDLPSQVQYGLGGLTGMRGLPLGDDHFKGRNILLTSAEYRHLLLKDIDINLWIFRIRDIQGALFTDAGHVTNTVQERANRIAFPGAASRTLFKDLFNVTEFSADAGYGIRLLVDYLGVNPGLLRIDVAKSLTERGSNLRYYFGVTQSF